MLRRPCLTLCVCAAAWNAQAGLTFQRAGRSVRWPAGKVAIEVSQTVHLASPSAGIDHSDSTAAVHAAVWDAAQAWMAASRSPVEIELRLTARSPAGESGNLITFTDPAPYDSGLCDRTNFIACTVLRVAPDTGQPLSVQIAFNPYKRHSVSGLPGTQDLGVVLLHEFGHALGLDHSPIPDSIMHALVEIDLEQAGPVARFPIRQISADDALTLAALYATPATGIRGVVRQASVPVPGAHVLAMDPSGRPIFGTITAPDGSYFLPVDPGDYFVAAEPLDGPSFAAQFESLISARVFPSVYWTAAGGHPHQRDLVQVPVEAERTGLDFEVPEDGVLNADSIGVIRNGLYWGVLKVQVGRGRNYNLGVTREPAHGEGEIRSPGSPIQEDGSTTVNAAAPQLVRRRIRVPRDAALGPYLVEYSTTAGAALLAGSIRVVPGPEVVSVRSATTGGPAESFAPGQLISIQGADLAPHNVMARPWPHAPSRPTQLAGVSVRIGDRFAPLVVVSPSEIIAEIPSGMDTRQVSVQVVTGSGVESDPLPLALHQANLQ